MKTILKVRQEILIIRRIYIKYHQIYHVNVQEQNVDFSASGYPCLELCHPALNTSVATVCTNC